MLWGCRRAGQRGGGGADHAALGITSIEQSLVPLLFCKTLPLQVSSSTSLCNLSWKAIRSSQYAKQSWPQFLFAVTLIYNMCTLAKKKKKKLAILLLQSMTPPML